MAIFYKPLWKLLIDRNMKKRTCSRSSIGAIRLTWSISCKIELHRKYCF